MVLDSGPDFPHHGRMIRNISLPLLAGSLLVAPMARAFDVPRHVYTMDRLAEAQAAAWTDKKPIIFLYTDPKIKPT